MLTQKWIDKVTAGGDDINVIGPHSPPPETPVSRWKFTNHSRFTLLSLIPLIGFDWGGDWSDFSIYFGWLFWGGACEYRKNGWP